MTDSKKELAQVHESAEESNVTLLPTKLKKIDLHNPSAIRREMANVYRDMRADRIPVADGTKFVYTLDILMKTYKVAVLDERIQLLNYYTLKATISKKCK